MFWRENFELETVSRSSLDIAIVARLSSIFQCDEVYSFEWRSRWSSCSLYQSSVSSTSFNLDSPRQFFSLSLVTPSSINSRRWIEVNRAPVEASTTKISSVVNLSNQRTFFKRSLVSVVFRWIWSRANRKTPMNYSLNSSANFMKRSVPFSIPPHRAETVEDRELRQWENERLFFSRSSRRTSGDPGDFLRPTDQWRREGGRLASSRQTQSHARSPNGKSTESDLCLLQMLI